MKLRPFIAVPTDLRQWSRYLSDITVTITQAEVVDLVADLAAKVDDTTQVIAGAGLDGGGPLSADVTLSLEPIAANTISANLTAGSAIPTGVTAAQVLAFLGRLEAFKAGDTTITSSAVLAVDPHLNVTVVAGTYDFEAFLCFYEPTSGAGGFQFDVNGGSATISAILWAADGYITGVAANAAAVSASATQAYATIVTSATAPSWVRATGQVTFSTPGTFVIRWAQNSSSANGTTLKAQSTLSLRKVA